ncbi:MAG: hypothetical protein IPG23_08495 [Burkholderiales bacterium]|nr:hypothetical protein [Burkholderiales bacterium]
MPNLTGYAATGVSIIALSACGPSPEIAKYKEQTEVLQRQLDALIVERNSLKSRIEELSNTPGLLLTKVAEPAATGKLEEAETALHTIKEKYPLAPEAMEAQKLVDVLRIKQEKQQEEDHRLQAQGFMALKISPVIDAIGIKISVGVPNFTKQFVFDRYGDRYHFLNADRDHKFVVIGLSATAEKGVGDPELPGFALYWADGKQLRKIDNFDLRFARWEDYATYLGNYGDSRNDFAKTATVPFAIGAHGSDERLANRPLYVVATTHGCQKRQYKRFHQPPEYYVAECADLAETLSLASFSTGQGKLTLVRRIDK